jgi:hypothetical protein
MSEPAAEWNNIQRKSLIRILGLQNLSYNRKNYHILLVTSCSKCLANTYLDWIFTKRILFNTLSFSATSWGWSLKESAPATIYSGFWCQFWITVIFGQAQTIQSISIQINMNSDRIPIFFSLVNYSFNTRNIHSKIG